MTISIQDIPSILVEPTKINYLKELIYLSGQESTNSEPQEQEQDVKLLNTLELFTFGDYDDYIKYKENFIELNELMMIKLIKLTIISINIDFINQIISFDKIKQKYGINISEIYQIIIELNFQNLINIQIDDVHNVLIIKEKKILRDVYDDNDDKNDGYKLRILNEDQDLGITKLVRLSKLKLQAWINEKLIPVKNEIENRIDYPPSTSITTATTTTSQDRFEKTRKRKTPDNI